MLAAERQRRNQKQMERRAKPARRPSRFLYPKTAAPRLHQSRCDLKNQNPQNRHLMARFDWGFGAICFGASPVAAVFGSAPGSATPPEHRIHSNPISPSDLSKQDISTLLGIGHFYFALTCPLRRLSGHRPRLARRATNTAIADKPCPVILNNGICRPSHGPKLQSIDHPATPSIGGNRREHECARSGTAG